MTVKLASLKADLEREAAGDWIDYPDWPGVSFNVKSLHVPAYTIARDMMIQRLSRKYKGKTPPPEVLAEEGGKIYCKHILFGWRGLDEEYTAEKAIDVMTDPAYRLVVSAVEWCAGQVSERDVEFSEDATKKSGRPSAGA